MTITGTENSHSHLSWCGWKHRWHVKKCVDCVACSKCWYCIGHSSCEITSTDTTATTAVVWNTFTATKHQHSSLCYNCSTTTCCNCCQNHCHNHQHSSLCYNCSVSRCCNCCHNHCSEAAAHLSCAEYTAQLLLQLLWSCETNKTRTMLDYLWTKHLATCSRRSNVCLTLSYTVRQATTVLH